MSSAASRTSPGLVLRTGCPWQGKRQPRCPTVFIQVLPLISRGLNVLRGHSPLSLRTWLWG